MSAQALLELKSEQEHRTEHTFYSTNDNKLPGTILSETQKIMHAQSNQIPIPFGITRNGENQLN